MPTRVVRARERGETIVSALVFDGIAYASNETSSQRLPERLEAMLPTQVQQIQANDSRGDFLLAVLDSTSLNARSVRRSTGSSNNTVGRPSAGAEPTQRSAKLRRSDHSAFWDQGYPGMLLTDTANFRNPHYHFEEGRDAVDSLDMDFAQRAVRSSQRRGRSPPRPG